MVTIKDIAKVSNCSSTTVSFILNEHPLAKNISDETKKRVFEAVEKLQYVPNAYAKTLREGNPRTIGIICFDLTDPYCSTVLHGIEKYLNKKKYYYHLADVGSDMELMKRFFHNAKSRNIRGIIGILNSMSIDPGAIVDFLHKDMKFVSIGRVVSELKVPSVHIDNAKGAKLGIHHLYELGHRDIAFVVGPMEIEGLRYRWQGVQDACAESGIEIKPELVEEIKDLPATLESGCEGIGRLLARGVPFSAVFTFDDLVAYGVIQELSRKGISVPKDVSVLGFDDIWPSKCYTPSLSTIHQPMAEMGAKSAELVVDALTQNKEKKETWVCKDVVLEPELIVRESTSNLGETYQQQFQSVPIRKRRENR